MSVAVGLLVRLSCPPVRRVGRLWLDRSVEFSEFRWRRTYARRGRWCRINEVVDVTGLKANTIRRRVSRLDQRDQDRFVRRVVDEVDGGKPRIELHRELVQRWVTTATPDITNPRAAAPNVVDLLSYSHALAEAEILRQRNADLESQLAEREFALAEARDRLRALGEVVQQLTK